MTDVTKVEIVIFRYFSQNSIKINCFIAVHKTTSFSFETLRFLLIISFYRPYPCIRKFILHSGGRIYVHTVEAFKCPLGD